MASKKTAETAATTDENPSVEENANPIQILTSKQEVADALKMSVYQFNQLLRKYPFRRCGSAGKLNGRWHVAADDLWRWYRYVQRQEIRHPDSRRMRPEEPPELTEIRAR